MEERKIQPDDLKRVNIFSSQPKPVLSQIIALGTIKVYQAGATIYDALTVNTRLIIVLNGSIELSVVSIDQSVPIEILTEAQLWGYTTLLHPGKKYPYSVINRDTVTEVIELPVAQLLKLFQESSRDSKAIIYELARMRSTRSAHRQKKLALLYGLSRLVNEPTGLNEQLAQALELVCYAVDAEKALIATFDATDKSAVIKSVLRYPNELKNTRINLSEDTVLSVLYNTGEGMRVSETNYERKYDTASYAAPTMLLAPLRTQGAVTGALLCAGKKNMRDFTPDESLLLETAGPLLSTMLNEKNDSETAQSAAQVKNDYVLPYNRQ